MVGFHWGKLLRKVEEAASLEEAQSVHRAYLTSLTLHCFLGGAAKGPLVRTAQSHLSCYSHAVLFAVMVQSVLRVYLTSLALYCFLSAAKGPLARTAESLLSY